MYAQSKIILIHTQSERSLIRILQTSYLDQPFIFILCLLVWICQPAGVTISPETQINGIIDNSQSKGIFIVVKDPKVLFVIDQACRKFSKQT